MNIDSLTVEGIEKLEVFVKFKDEAKRLYKTVVDKQKIGLFPNKRGVYTVWKDDHNEEYLINKDGGWKWVADYLHQHYEVPITENGIFEMMKLGYEWSIDPDKKGYVNNNQDAIKYFTSYVDYRLK